MSFGWASLIGQAIQDTHMWLGKAYDNREAKDAFWRQANWQTEMSNTAHQREVEDLRKAGLNPILSAGGSGAPMGNATSSSSHGGAPTGHSMAFFNAKQLGLMEERQKRELAMAEKKNEAEVDLMQAQADETVTRSMLNEDNSALTNIRSREVGFTLVREAQKHDLDIANAQIELELKRLKRATEAWGLSYQQYKGFYSRLFSEIGKISGGSVSSSSSSKGGKGGKGGTNSNADSGDIAGAIDTAIQRMSHEDNIEQDFKSFRAVEDEAINSAKLYLLKVRKDRIENYNHYSEYFKIDRRERK